MLLRLLILLTVVPLIELTILLKLAERFDWGPTIALVLVTGAVGAWLARREGLKTLMRIQQDLTAGAVPTDALVDAAIILAAGLVLVTPGIITDLVGFALLIAPIRRWTRLRLMAAFRRRVVAMGPDVAQRGERSEFVDVSATSRPAEEPPNRLNP